MQWVNVDKTIPRTYQIFLRGVGFNIKVGGEYK